MVKIEMSIEQLLDFVVALNALKESEGKLKESYREANNQEEEEEKDEISDSEMLDIMAKTLFRIEDKIDGLQKHARYLLTRYDLK